MITYRKGNLLDTDDHIIVHGCNAQGKMNSGVAKAILEKYPKAYDDYKERHRLDIKYNPLGHIPLGIIIPSEQPDGKTIINAITQLHYGYDGKKYVNYDAIDEAFRTITQEFGPPDCGHSTNISMPMIGSGLGGGDWGIIERIIERHMVDFRVTVWFL